MRKTTNYKRQAILFIVIFSAILSCRSQQTDSEDRKDDKKNNVKVGTWYFGGWSFPPEDAAGHTFHISPTLVKDYAYREPIWGWREDSYETMVEQINYATNGGLSFWGFCWYENSLVPAPKLMDNLNNALDIFLKAPNRNNLDFFVLSCHPVSQENWGKVCDRTIALFKEPNYLKVDGKPIMVFFNTDDGISGMGGVAGVKDALRQYREKAREQGLGEILIGARTRPMGSDPRFQDKYKDCGFDFLTTYQNADDGRKHADVNDYKNLIQGDKKAWKEISENTDLPYVPTMGVGYDMRPWAQDH
ncbi:MAG TPA: glycoside hydrolase family 99-like domain-containing protein, partial [Sphingobacterium sp.]|nr:glycoside hydrolase family 99-like domain-containing protein [Sphingobacterium sp.]